MQQYGTSQCTYIDKLGVGPILPLLHEIDAIAKLQRLDVPVLVQRHAPRWLARAHTPITPRANTRAHARARVWLCLCAVQADCVTAADGDL